MNKQLAAWEPYGRSVMRIVFAFIFMLHGLRMTLGMFPAGGGRRGAVGAALDGLPPYMGALEIAGGLLLFLGLFTRWTAAVLCVEALAAYLFIAASRATWPIRNGGSEALLYFLVFLYCAIAGAGAWSIDHLLARNTSGSSAPARA